MKKYNLVYFYEGGYFKEYDLNIFALMSYIFQLKIKGLDYEYEKVI